jgi:isocitrate dehydrogenase kinase/phosphatase
MNSVVQASDYPQLIAATKSERARIELAAGWIRRVFDQFYEEFLRLTWSAKTAFETRDYPESVACAKKRLGLYNATVYALAWDLRAAFSALAQRESLWTQVEAAYLPAVAGRYEADLALAYIHSVRRRVYHGEWRPVEYGFGEQRSAASSGNTVFERFACSWPVDHRVIQKILEVAELSVPFRAPASDAMRIARRLNDVLAGRTGGAKLIAIEMIRGGFFRNRGAYLVGRLVLSGEEYKPFVIALLNEPDGVVAAAVLHVVSHVHNLFNTTEAPCQVTNLHYH